MAVTSDRVFYFHADASAVGGHLTHPEQLLLPTQASCSLAQAGGKSSASAERLRFDRVLNVASARTDVTGGKRANGGWSTLATTVVEGLNLLDVVTADRLVARLSVEHPAEGYQPKVSVVGSTFINLRISGRPVEVPISLNLFARLPGGEYPDRPWPSQPTLVNTAVSQSQRITSSPDLPDALRRRYAWVESGQERAEKGYLLCSLVGEVKGEIPGQSFGHILVIPGFGVLFLGEVMVAQNAFKLTMLRAELGCSVEGTVGVASAHTNGAPMP